MYTDLNQRRCGKFLYSDQLIFECQIGIAHKKNVRLKLIILSAGHIDLIVLLFDELLHFRSAVFEDYPGSIVTGRKVLHDELCFI